MHADYVLAWSGAFLLTLLIEVPVFVAASWGRASPGRAALSGAAGTALTHPALWFVWARLITSYSLFLVSGELLVAAVEAVVFWRLARVDLRTAVAASLLANAASLALGLVLRAAL